MPKLTRTFPVVLPPTEWSLKQLPPCDDIDNLSTVALDQMSDAAAHATISLATEHPGAINGVRGKGNFNVKKSDPPTPVLATSQQ